MLDCSWKNKEQLYGKNGTKEEHNNCGKENGGCDFDDMLERVEISVIGLRNNIDIYLIQHQCIGVFSILLSIHDQFSHSL